MPGFWQLKSAVKNSPQKSLKINTLTLGKAKSHNYPHSKEIKISDSVKRQVLSSVDSLRFLCVVLCASAVKKSIRQPVNPSTLAYVNFDYMFFDSILIRPFCKFEKDEIIVELS